MSPADMVSAGSCRCDPFNEHAHGPARPLVEILIHRSNSKQFSQLEKRLPIYSLPPGLCEKNPSSFFTFHHPLFFRRVFH